MDARPAMPSPCNPQQQLRLLSFNVQVGMETRHYGHYVTRAWRHALPWNGHHASLNGIADLIGDYDFVALQEAEVLRQHLKLRNSGLRLSDVTPATFPSWRPRRSIDHVLVSPDVTIHALKTLPPYGSDHLPLAVEISVDAIA